MKKRVIHVGDVFEFKTRCGLAYAQVTHIDASMGEIVRTIPGFFDVRPAEICTLVQKEKRFITIIPLRYMGARKFPILRNCPIPKEDVRFPKFRSGFPDPNTRRMVYNSIYDGHTWSDVDPRKIAGLRDLPIYAAVTEASFVDWVERTDWSWEAEG